MNWKRCYFGWFLCLACSTCQMASAEITGEYLLEGTAADTSGFGRNGTLEGSPSFTTGLYDGSSSALLLDGTSQTVSLPSSTDFIRNAPGATLMAWVRPDDLTGTRTIMVANNGDVASGDGIGAARAIIQVANDQFRVLGRQIDGGSSSNVNSFTPEIGRTYLVAGVFDYVGNAIRLYVDGEDVASNTNPGWAANSADTANLVARIGSHANGTQEFWQGAIDGARIYNEVLSPTDIFDIYLAETLTLPGDTDGDGIVEPEDLTPIRTNYRQTVGTRMEGDLTGDLFVDFSDFREWKTAILAGGGSLDGVNLSFLSVPEPSCVALFGMGIVGLWMRRRDR